MPGKKNKRSSSAPQEERLLIVCRLLNKAKAKYLVVGAMACSLHGLIRATRDVDIFIPKDTNNTKKVLVALNRLPLHLATELDAAEVTRKPFTIIGDWPRVDLLTVAGSARWNQAAKSSKSVRIRRVLIPFVDLDTLLKTKDTDRLQDKADAERLRRLHGVDE